MKAVGTVPSPPNRRQWTKGLKRPLRSAVVGVLAALVAGQVHGFSEPWVVGAGIGITHYMFDRFLAWVFSG